MKSLIFSITNLLIFSFLFAGVINIPADYSTIQAGLNAADSSDTVLVQPGTYYENIIWPDKNGIKLISAGDSSNTIIDGGRIGSVIYLNSQTATVDTNTLILGFKITNGGGISNGGGILMNGASPVLQDISICHNRADDRGGGIYLVSSNPTLIHVTIYDNIVTGNNGYGGGIYLGSSSPKLDNVKIFKNVALKCGGGMCLRYYSYPSLTYVTISNNSAYYNGGGIYLETSSPTITYSTISDNSANNNGGGIYIEKNMLLAEYSEPKITEVTISDNNANNNGGGIYFSSYSSPQLKGLIVCDNTAKSSGGGIWAQNSSNLTKLINVKVCGNSAKQYGGGIYLESFNPLITDVTIFNNSASYGGGISLVYSHPVMTNLVIYSNRANQCGGGMHISSSNTIISALTIANNYSENFSGGIYIKSGNPTISNNNFISNRQSIYNPNNANLINAINNYWGDSSGPYHPAQNPTGRGDSVNQWVNVTPWLTEPNIDAPPIPVQNLQISSIGNDFIELSWDPSPLGDLSGYKICYKTDASEFFYTDTIDVGNVTSYSLSGLPAGSSYYIAAICYDTDGNNSWYSEEVVGTTRIMEAQNLDIGGDEDITYLTNHTPIITFDYYDSMGETQTHYYIQISSYADFNTIDLWNTGEIASDATSVVYDGNTLEDG
ncbi:MAG: fibronectin type III domain-containing protein, partial [Mariniphaga sp.]|nr:fibronectin type III domain-containing protein [Mariniphaga sp.]